MQRRIRTVAALLAVAAVSSAAHAQSGVIPRTESQVAAQQLLNAATLATSNSMVSSAAASDEQINLIRESAPSSNFGPLSLHESNTGTEANRDEEKSERGFFGTTTGRLSIFGLAGLAGASYYALSSNGPSASFDSPTANPLAPGSGLNETPAVLVNPEPATIALLALGLGTLGLIARRRRSN